jgi:hypothetical protein
LNHDKAGGRTSNFHREFWSIVRARRDILDLAQCEHAVDNLAKDDVLPVKEIARSGRDEELYKFTLRKTKDEEGITLKTTYLAAVRVGTRIRLYVVSVSQIKRVPSRMSLVTHHRQKAWTSMFHLEILVLEFNRVRKRRQGSALSKKRTGYLSPYIENDPVPSALRKSPPFYYPRIRSVHLSSYLRNLRTLAHEIWYSEQLRE